jgi:protoporphyrinogen oxidase
MKTDKAPVVRDSVAIIGAGPAGLTAAYILLKESTDKMDVTIFERDPAYVGGISRTAKYKGFYFDIGGHRFFSKSKEIEDLWTEILPRDMLVRARSSRIYYRHKFFTYPLKIVEVLSKLGIIESTRCAFSYLKSRLAPVKNPTNFEDWVGNKFGKRLFSIFFKTYTEKVWGMKCKDISADWAAQRIKGLSLASAVKNSLTPKRWAQGRKQGIKSLIESFRYPRRGPGMMWEACAEKIKSMGGTLLMGQRVTGCEWDKDSGSWAVISTDASGSQVIVKAHHLISSAPLRELANSLSPPMSEQALEAANSLKYRDFLTVVLILKDLNKFPDNWIYIHDSSVKVGRIQNFKSWSPEMVTTEGLCCYGLEYFCFEGDSLWASTDQKLIELGKSEIEKVGLAKADEVLDGCVVRQAKAYPVYDEEYSSNLKALRAEMEIRFPTLQVIGRNGMHKYNNQDHAMMTGMLCARNIISGANVYDVWRVNQDAAYHEDGDEESQSTSAGGLRHVPMPVSEANATK